MSNCTNNNAWKYVSETFRLQLTFQTIPRRPSQSGLSTSWQMTFDLTATLDLWSKPSLLTPRSSAPLGAAHRINEGMRWLRTLSTVGALSNIFLLSSFFAPWKSQKIYSRGHKKSRLPFNCNLWKSKQHKAKALTLTYFFLYCCTKNCLKVCLISISSSYFHSFPLIKLSPTAVSSFLPPPATILWFSHRSAVGLENRPRAIANASIFGHVDGTRGMRLLHNPPPIPPSIQSIHPFSSSFAITVDLLTSSFFLFIARRLSSLPNPNSHGQIKHQLAGVSVLSSLVSH